MIEYFPFCFEARKAVTDPISFNAMPTLSSVKAVTGRNRSNRMKPPTLAIIGASVAGLVAVSSYVAAILRARKTKMKISKVYKKLYNLFTQPFVVGLLMGSIFACSAISASKPTNYIAGIDGIGFTIVFSAIYVLGFL